MRKADRQGEILTLLRENPNHTVTQLSNILQTSQVTIRKDLTELEATGHLIRSYGRAVLRENTGASCFIPPEMHTDFQKKQKIGQLASTLVKDEDFIFIGPGYTCLEVSKNLSGRNRLSIMTTNVSAAIELSALPESKVRLAPGDFTKRNGTYYVTGSATVAFFENTYFDQIFITVDGISPTRGFSVLDESTVQIYRSIMKQGTRVVICATCSKFGKNALAHLGGLEVATHVVCDDVLPVEYQTLLRSHGIEILDPAHPEPV